MSTATAAAEVPGDSPAAGTGPDPGRSLLGLLAPVKRRLLTAVAVGGLAAACGVAGFVLIALALRELLATDPLPAKVFGLIGAALAAILGRLAFRSLAVRVAHEASFDLEVHLRTALTGHLGKVPLGEVSRLGSGAIKKVVQDDVRALHVAVADITPQLGFCLVQPIAALGALAFVDWRLLLAVLAIGPVVWIGMRLAGRDQAELRREFYRANEEINKAVVEFVQGMPVVRAFDDGSTSFRRFADRVDEFTATIGAWQASGKSAAVLTRVAMTPVPTLVLILLVGVPLTLADAMDPPTLLVGLLIGTLPIESVTPIMYLAHFVNESKAGAARIEELLAIPPMPEPEHPLPPRDGSVSLRGVTFWYGDDRGRPALDDVDIHIPAGTVCALVGPSGSGKSTIARLIPRFFDVQRGSVEVGGVDVRRIGTGSLLRHVALVFQEPFLLDDTIAANIRLARPDAADEDVVRAARAAQAHDFIVGELPEGYETKVGERGTLLSGGQRQRITIARAMLSDAPVVVLDEATAYADPENEAAIQAGIARLTRDRTVIVIAHRLSSVTDADQIVVIHRGRVVERGTHAELVGRDGTYHHLWNHHERARRWG
ncbi:ABC transporter ATP-binding protein [Amycolatopsis sp. EV170708-02-1]|uniref:ABC transporter ATP-binding protein n=1 Tax=Amycolatopsis sp. EV170708-02-1 TaxID=2919322 RepID=UPI001F0C48F7|nr:ABC transporter ATP-binding protein [Amycolatopsis sp. EV170708-02-1]UMP01309.1 ABC transporter ATP-binding protein/permease [Amycolatopsis sp. EV170708-02-1]